MLNRHCKAIVRIEDHGDAGGPWRDLLQRRQHLADDRELIIRKSHHVAAGPREAFDIAGPDWIRCARDDDRNRAGQPHQDWNDAASNSDDGVGMQLHEIGAIGSHQVHIVGGPTLVEFDVAAPRPSQPLQLLSQCANTGLPFGIGRKVGHPNPDAPHALALLRARRERPRCSRAADERDELPPPHSITSSARASSGSGKVRRGNYRLVSSFMSAARTTLPHLSESSAKSFPNSAGDSASAVPPNSPSRALSLGSARPALISLLSLSTISVGVVLGAPRPNQTLASYPGRNSPTVGTSGSTGERVAGVTANGRSLPVRMCSVNDSMPSNMTCARPPSRSVSAGAAPRYGTWSMSTPAIILNSSPAMCGVVPLPTDAMMILPGLALA